MKLYDTSFMDVVPPIAAFAAMGGSIGMAVGVAMYSLFKRRRYRA